jgi:hypothetical protein
VLIKNCQWKHGISHNLNLLTWPQGTANETKGSIWEEGVLQQSFKAMAKPDRLSKTPSTPACAGWTLGEGWRDNGEYEDYEGYDMQNTRLSLSFSKNPSAPVHTGRSTGRSRMLREVRRGFEGYDYYHDVQVCCSKIFAFYSIGYLKTMWVLLF